MRYTAWDDSLATGYKRIDTDHKRLIELMDQLRVAMKKGRGNAILGNTLLSLQEYARLHFAREEIIIVGKCPDHYDEHKTQHEYFTSSVRVIISGFESNLPVLTLDAMDLLKDWLVNHIRISDMAVLK